MNQIISITCHDYGDYKKVTGSVDIELTTAGKLSVFYLKEKFDLKSVHKIVVVNGIEKCVGIPFDANGYSDASFTSFPSLKITGELKIPFGFANSSSLVGQVLSVSINQSKLMKKYLSPVGSSPATLVENSSSSIDFSTLGLELESSMFYRSTTSRPCIVIDVERDYDYIGAPPPITIVFITGFDGNSLCKIMAEEEFKRVIPIYPTASALHTTPEWLSHPNRKIPSYVLCIPIKVYPHNLRRFEDSVQLDAQNLEKLKLHMIFLGGVKANADFEDLEEDDSDDDDVEVTSGEMNRIIRWHDIVV